ncbi:DIX domain protein [Dictyocaulus viviparus]|uniref:DIX domain protein n=1 Tax=Dictyocaulus viviparus TaxID=29172 RepID=A0A0D8XQG8_DICVI|nr:DIX domain protein [Dictyocaulus viviparus]
MLYAIYSILHLTFTIGPTNVHVLLARVARMSSHKQSEDIDLSGIEVNIVEKTRDVNLDGTVNSEALKDALRVEGATNGLCTVGEGEVAEMPPSTMVNQPFPLSSTKVYYHIDDEPTPYLTEVHVPPDLITLGDVKRVLMRSNFKYYCKALDQDTGCEVKAEIRDDMERLHRSSNGRFELFLLTTEGSTHSDGGSSGLPKTARHHMVPGPAPTSMYHLSQNAYRHGVHQYDNSLLSTDSESMVSAPVPHYMKGCLNMRHVQQHYIVGHRGRRFEDSTIGSESDARVFSDDDERGSTTTDITSVSRQHENMYRKQRRRRQYRRPSRASSFSSITESSMSLDVDTVILNMDTVNFLGISIVGQSSARGDNGIYVANIMKGGAVALDGRISAGDMILQVNDISFDNFTNDQAVDVLRDAVARKGPIKLTVAKCFDSGPKSCFTIPRNHRDEPVRPIDTQAWIQHTNAMRGMPSILEGSEGAPTPIPGDWPHGRPTSSSTVTSTGSNGQNTIVTGQNVRLDIHTEKKKVVEVMAKPNSGLDIKNRTWLKIPIPMSFLGKDLLDWLLTHVDGLLERKDARKYAAELLKRKLISHVVNKITFTEQCYYVFGEECADFARFRAHPEDLVVHQQHAVQQQRLQWSTVPSGVKGPASMVSDAHGRMYVMDI